MLTSIELKDDRSEKVHYDTPDYPIYIRNGYLSRYPHYAAPNHWHDDIEFIAVLSGEMKYNVNGKIIRLPKGSGIFVNAGQMHFGFSDTMSECIFICILLHPMLLCAAPSYENDFVFPVIRNRSIPYIFLDPDTSWQESILEQIHLMYAKKGQKSLPLDVQSAFSAIWSLLYQNIPADTDQTLPQSNDLTRYRLNKSIELLRGTDLSVTEIALSVGFNGSSYYAETFCKWIGKSPTEFRCEETPDTSLQQ